MVHAANLTRDHGHGKVRVDGQARSNLLCQFEVHQEGWL